MDVDGKAAIVTGGGTGVGRATALELAKGGCSVLINYSRSRREAETTAEEIAATGVRGVAIQADVADDAACRAMVQRAVSEFGRLDCLVNNAGTTVFVPHGDLERLDDNAWDRTMAVNVRGPFQCARAARGPIEASGGGEIVNVSSIAGITGTGSSLPYCASKAALNMLTLTLARTLGPAIRVNAVAPGFITGRWLETGLGDAYQQVKHSIESQVPLRRVCDPEDVASTIVGLILGSDLVTGQVLAIDGGATIHPGVL